MSRPLILVYAMTLAASLYFGFGYVAPVVDGKFAPSLAILLSLAAVVAWLFGSAKMRIYYALLRDRPLPKRLAERAIEHVEEPWPGRRAAGVLEWLSEHLETVVLIGLIVTVHLACVSMDPY